MLIKVWECISGILKAHSYKILKLDRGKNLEGFGTFADATDHNVS